MRKTIMYETVETDFFEDINMREPIDIGVKKSDIFVLITNNASDSFENIIYNKDLDELAKSLKKYQDRLDKEYLGSTELEYVHSSEGTMIGFRGYWANKEFSKIYYEAFIIKAKIHDGSEKWIDEGHLD
ncbi:hypothetical protein [Vagococcus fluvialis]|uniref:hypothetical protein n=1 Tax=Vagococcus fluvialis TaxID=2738 RepID=UPI00379B38BA